MISSLLIANRGEIARRIIRTARRLGIRTVAVYSEADANAPHVREADEAVLIGPAPARESYLVPDKLIAAARQTGAEAIHPGYGFLSENAGFAEAVLAAGLVWVGPPPASIRAMGLKDAAKKRMADAGVPTTPGYLGEDQAPERLHREADGIGYPVLIKAVAGGGGKGMRKVDRSEDFPAALVSCRREASSSFGDDRVLLEKYVTRPRHIEVQVFADTHGQAVHLFERDCSLQRRHQKVIEEAPAPGMDAATRESVCQAAVRAARAVGYEGAGTIEFIADASEGLRADRIWFMEMNTRLQVEHPVTEAITGQDLVEWQLRIASGEPLPLTQDQLRIQGHAMEARLYAESPATGFLPSTGPLTHFVLPTDAVRVDSGVEQGGEVTSTYDPMIAKLIAHAPTRTQAAARLAAACRAVRVWPVKTNAAFLARCLEHPDFLAGTVDTGFIGARLDALVPRAEPSEAVLQAAAAARLTPPAAAPSGFRLNAPPRVEVRLESEGTRHVIPVAATPRAPALPVFISGEQTIVFERGQAYAFNPFRAEALAGEASTGGGGVLSPMPGRIVAVSVALNAAVRKGQPLVTLEAMKMEHTLLAPFDGVVVELTARAGAQVAEGVVLARLEPAAS
ncbi:acetyl-CoA carboxylase biotin carboxylase subunit [Archangium primigenium]|uniref:acetyl-CoA carboxylase biotin carboxylase subunit n=1 Tax=[Archangium] primigenium TaxID=2792470 RepID=UPI00195A61EE|nr:acetyl/propionyl/methylcrotonyl-CoA carboxylase subunit alpha [Archangium primigenium]MBM7117206.1 acetyl/propionyl/methylcrotonyl-CoA carboxylase subunit alpha [Archangium primigenium]